MQYPPEFYCTGISGTAVDGPNVQLSFCSFSPSGNDREIYVNVRLVMSAAAVDNMLDFLIGLRDGKKAPPAVTQ